MAVLQEAADQPRPHARSKIGALPTPKDSLAVDVLRTSSLTLSMRASSSDKPTDKPDARDNAGMVMSKTQVIACDWCSTEIPYAPFTTDVALAGIR